MFKDLMPHPVRERARWTNVRLGGVSRVFKANGGSKEDDVDFGVPCVRYGDLYTRFGTAIRDVERCVRTDVADRYTRVVLGDLLFAASGETIDDIGRCAVNLVTGDVRASGDIVVARPRREADPEFLALAVDTPAARRHKAVGATGTMIVHVGASAIKTLRVDLPSLGEQAAIVKYLAHAHRRIDRAIAAKRKLIALLEEQKQAIINQAVTRGLDTTVPLTDTGIPWLGQIPTHWAAWPLGRAARIGNGSTPSRSEPLYWDSGTFPWLNSSNANREIVDSSDQYVTRKALAECHLPVVQPGSVLVAITGQGKTRGRAAVLEIPATINQHLAYVAPRQSVITAPYLQAALGSAYGELRRISDDSGSTKGALTCQDLKSFRVPVPPLSEQTEIVELLGSSTKPTNAAMDRARREIDLLREFRTRLTADVVTGQLDVRDVAARLPELALDDLVTGAGDVDDDLEDEAVEFMEDAEA